MTGRWQDAFEPGRGRVGGGAPPSAVGGDPLDAEPAIDLAEYRPWVLQRVRSRPAMLLHLRRLELRSGLWMGWAMSYPHLQAVEYVGDQMLSLDFGTRHFVVQGLGLGQLIEPLQQGMVTALIEYSGAVWPQRPDGPVITSIQRLGGPNLTREADA